MSITSDFLRQRYAEFNRRMFDSKLPSNISFGISKAKTYAGITSFQKTNFFAGRTSFHNVSIRVSVLYEHTEQEYEDILLHEMIHVHALVTGAHFKETAHGNFFQREMNRINRDFGRNISVSEHISSEQKAKIAEKEVQSYFILFSNSRFTRGLIKIPGTQLFKVYRDRKGLENDLGKLTFYTTFSTLLNSFRRSTPPHFNIHNLSDEDYKTIMNHPSTVRYKFSRLPDGRLRADIANVDDNYD